MQKGSFLLKIAVINGIAAVSQPTNKEKQQSDCLVDTLCVVFLGICQLLYKYILYTFFFRGYPVWYYVV